jgi:hypothetical protein
MDNVDRQAQQFDNPDRRNFLKLLVGVPVGIASGELAIGPSITAVNAATHEVTGRPTGNASIHRVVEERCNDPKLNYDCPKDAPFTPKEQWNMQVTAPITEELVSRVVPSILTDAPAFLMDEEPSLIANTVYGRPRLGLNRREAIMGAVSTLVFGLGHNVRDGPGFDTKNIPAGQLTSGAVLWLLQRNFGALSSTTAHMAINNRALRLRQY